MASQNDHQASNGNTSAQDVEHNGQQTRTRAGRILENFSFLWFTISMNTGILSILMHQNPYQFNGLGILSTIMFVFNLVLFIFLFCILLLRIVIFPKSLFRTLQTNLIELAMTGAVPIAFFTIVAQVGLTVSQASWGAYPFTLVAYVLWWIGTSVMLSVAVFVFIMVAKYSVTDIAGLTPALVVPFVGTTTNAVVGAIIVSYSAEVGARIAVPVIVVSYLLTGIGLFAGFIVTTCYFAHLLNTGLPPLAQAPSLFLLVGPPGQAASALLLLGSAARMQFPFYKAGTALTAMGGEAFASIGVLLGLLVLGLALFFAVFAVYHVIEGAIKRELRYSLLWWGTIFPLATVNTAWTALATAMDSPAFAVLSSIFLIALLLDYFVNWGFTIYHLYTGKLLDQGPSEREKEQ